MTEYVNWPSKPYTEEDNAIMVLFSGGLDSTVMCADLASQGHTVVPIVFERANYAYENQFKPAILSSLAGLEMSHRALFVRSPNMLGMPYSKDSYNFSPGHKLMLWNIALSYAMYCNIWTLAAGYIDENDVRFGGYQDETDEFITQTIEHFNRWYATEPNNTVDVGDKRMTHITPYRKWVKADVIRRGVELGVNMGITRTCGRYGNGFSIHCGRCEGCRRRKMGFILAGVEDETIYTDYTFGRNMKPATKQFADLHDMHFEEKSKGEDQSVDSKTSE